MPIVDIRRSHTMISSVHKALANHFFLDALDLVSRYRAHWDSQPRQSSRIKSFIDLLMACECILKAQCLLGRGMMPPEEAYQEIRKLGHDIGKLSDSAKTFFPMPAHERAKQQFHRFNVGLRYSVDAHHYFLPPPSAGQARANLYSATLGSTNWMKESEAIVEELVAWGKEQFNGEIADAIEQILIDEELLWRAVTAQPAKRTPIPATATTTQTSTVGDRANLVEVYVRTRGRI